MTLEDIFVQFFDFVKQNPDLEARDAARTFIDNGPKDAA